MRELTVAFPMPSGTVLSIRPGKTVEDVEGEQKTASPGGQAPRR